MEPHRITAQNGRAWDEIAHIRVRREPPAEFFAAGNSTLDERVVEAVGHVRGKSLLHLQCSTGEEALSWAVLGAEAMGVDNSSVQIDLARQKAGAAGLEVQFMVADVCDLPSDLRSARFDIVYTGGGALVWLPALATWAEGIAACLKPGGVLVLQEGHPISNSMEVEDGKIVFDADYFGGEVSVHKGWRHFEGGEDAQETKYNISHTLGEVITVVAQAGLRIVSLTEYPSAEKWRFGEQVDEAAKLPGEYLLVASKTD